MLLCYNTDMRWFGRGSVVLLGVIVVLAWLAIACGASSSEPREYFYLSVTLDDDDLAEAAERIGAYTRDFECSGAASEDEMSGSLGCLRDSSGFTCEFSKEPAKVICAAGDEGAAPGDAFCSVAESPVSSGFLMRCFGSSGDAFCNIWLRDGEDVPDAEPTFGLACAPD